MSSTDEKTLPGIEALPDDHSSNIAASDGKLDSAWAFLDRHRDEALRLGASTQLSDVDIAVVRRKVDWHIVSLLFLCYTTQFLDKGAINDLKLVGSEFSNVATFFFVAYLIFEIPNSRCLTVWFLPHTPMQARWLSDAEKVVLLRYVSVNQTGVENRTKFRWAEILEALCDPQIYLLILSTICLSVPSGVVTTYSAALISHLGYNSKQAALMNMPSGAVSIFFILFVGYGIWMQSHRWAWTLACIIPGEHCGVSGIYLVNAITAPLPIFYAWTAANVAGSTKRAFAAALVSGFLSIGIIIGPQTFQPRDAPDYRPAKLAVMGSLAGAALTTCLLFCYYYIENRRRDRSSSRKESKDSDLSEEDLLSRERWLNVTDRKNKRFRYVY
ncbi:major facilitator superfamily domain-containing protein [Roridomyces roridus]|uniref:Major facilitator superfamily domain-containing protein n=1 Tax=Roridomyces roridus TaxID=1738132 RepID=A0AAD7F7W4_9AGAR|nr:major facilitator superfamily domain-containing protein [Roridomyces roridus]